MSGPDDASMTTRLAPSQPEPPAWLTIDQLADMIQITERHVRRLVAEDRIPVTRVGRRLRFNRIRIQSWLDDNTSGPGHGDGA